MGKQEQKQEQIDPIELELEEYRKKSEQQNHQLVEEDRKKLRGAFKVQKQTTEELQRQGEKLSNISQTAGEIYKNAKKGQEITEDIKREGKLFKFPNIFKKIKNIFKPKDKTLEEIEKRKKEHPNKIKSTEINSKTGATTDESLKLLLGDLKAMRQETENQNEEIKKQRVDIKHITKTNKESEKIMNKTTQELRKI